MDRERHGGWVYIMADRYRGAMYVGMTSDLAARIYQHRNGSGSDFCKRYGLYRLVWAEHIVFVFPLWLGTMPAMLKAFLEQVMRPGTAFAYPDEGGGFTKTLLRGRSARVVVTMGMPSVLYRLWFLGHGLAGMRRSILHFVGISPVRETFFGMVAAASDATRAKWIRQMRGLGELAR